MREDQVHIDTYCVTQLKSVHTPLNCNGVEEEEGEEEDPRGGGGVWLYKRYKWEGLRLFRTIHSFYTHTTIKIKALILCVFKVDPPLDETGPRDHLEHLKD